MKVQSKSALLLVIYLCWRDCIFPIPLPQSVHYIIMGIFALFLTFRGFRVNYLSLAFILVGAISILFADPDPTFQSWPRLMAFILLMFAAGPINISIQAMEFRTVLFKYALFGIVFMSVGSLLAYFSGNGIFYHGTGFFRGLYNHSMTLGPMAAISAVFTLQLFLTDVVRKRRKWWLLLTICSTLMCLLASSRTAFIALLGAVLVLLWTIYRERRGQMWFSIIIGIVLICLTMPLWKSFTAGMMQKQEKQSLDDNSRTELWQDRIEEWKDSPIFGQGFAAFNLKVIKGESFNAETGGIEPGSSWLFVLSSMGGVGFILLIFLTVYPTLCLLSRRDIEPDSMAMTALTTSVIFIIHMISEGYIIAAGGVTCFLAWLTFSIINRNVLEYNDLFVKKWITEGDKDEDSNGV